MISTQSPYPLSEPENIGFDLGMIMGLVQLLQSSTLDPATKPAADWLQQEMARWGTHSLTMEDSKEEGELQEHK